MYHLGIYRSTKDFISKFSKVFLLQVEKYLSTNCTSIRSMSAKVIKYNNSLVAKHGVASEAHENLVMERDVFWPRRLRVPLVAGIILEQLLLTGFLTKLRSRATLRHRHSELIYPWELPTAVEKTNISTRPRASMINTNNVIVKIRGSLRRRQSQTPSTWNFVVWAKGCERSARPCVWCTWLSMVSLHSLPLSPRSWIKRSTPNMGHVPSHCVGEYKAQCLCPDVMWHEHLNSQRSERLC